MNSVLTTILLLAGIVLCATATWAFVRMAASAQSMQLLAEDLHERLIPLSEKADVTVDAMNAELLRLDMIVTQIEDASRRFASASSAVQGVVNAPIGAVNELSDRLRKTMAARKAKQE